MSTRADTAELEGIVKQRTRELREARVGYSDAVAALADELYRNERGQETRLGELGAGPGLAGALFGTSAKGGALFGKTKKEKARAIEALETAISPWVSDVYEEE